MIKHLFLTAFFMYALSSTKGYGQVYEKIYAESSIEIQNKIDANKISGIEILTGIFSDHQVGLTGLTNANLEEFKTLLSNNDQIKFFQVGADLKSIIITSNAIVTKEKLIELFGSMHIGIIGYQITYHL